MFTGGVWRHVREMRGGGGEMESEGAREGKGEEHCRAWESGGTMRWRGHGEPGGADVDEGVLPGLMSGWLRSRSLSRVCSHGYALCGLGSERLIRPCLVRYDLNP